MNKDEIGPLAAETMVKSEANHRVRAGYHGRQEIIDLIAECLAEVRYDRADIERIVECRWEAQILEQRGWPQVTDNDRLERAFGRLVASGIVAKEDFSCCQTCGLSEIGDERPEGVLTDGYAFFHMQDTESGVNCGELFLSYGAFSSEKSDDKTVEVGERVVAALKAEGLRTEWSGSAAERIKVFLTWQRRLLAG